MQSALLQRQTEDAHVYVRSEIAAECVPDGYMVPRTYTPGRGGWKRRKGWASERPPGRKNGGGRMYHGRKTIRKMGGGKEGGGGIWVT